MGLLYLYNQEENPASNQEIMLVKKLSLATLSSYFFDREDFYEIGHKIDERRKLGVKLFGLWKGTYAASAVNQFMNAQIHLTYPILVRLVTKIVKNNMVNWRMPLLLHPLALDQIREAAEGSGLAMERPDGSKLIIFLKRFLLMMVSDRIFTLT